VDYPYYAALVARAVAVGEASHGILVCGTGIGMAMAANKVDGVRAAQCSDVEAARLSRQHDDTNVLTLGARTTGRDAALAIVDAWLATGFEGGRHSRRLEKVSRLERRDGRGGVLAEATTPC
jgi:ribose 5-phosphate isomerase B